MTENVKSESAADREIVISRVFEAPRERVFEAMTDPEQVVHWWGPQGFSTTIQEMDVRPGGVWKHTMHGPDGADYPNKSIFQEVVKPERIVYKHAGGKEEGGGASFTASWTFEPEGDKARVTIRMIFPTAQDRDRVVKEYNAIEGGKQTLGRLDEYLLTKGIISMSGLDLVITRVFDAPRERVWKAWTEPEQMMRWWGPKVFTLPVCKMDFRVGGKYLYCMRSDSGPETWQKGLWGTGVYKEIVPMERLVFTDSFADEQGNVVPASHYGMEGMPLETLVTVTFEDAPGNKTKMTLCHAGIGPMHEGAGTGWNEMFDKLAAAVRI